MSLSACIFIYVVGVLVSPFFYSLINGWPFITPREADTVDTAFIIVMCTMWPVVAFIWLLVVWWCGMSRLGTSARDLCSLKKTVVESSHDA